VLPRFGVASRFVRLQNSRVGRDWGTAAGLAVLLAAGAVGSSASAQSPRSGFVRHERDHSVLQVYLQPGETLVAGTCGLPGAWFQGDTTLRLVGPQGETLEVVDDACGGLGSHLRHTATSARPGPYTLVAGCHDSSACHGLVAWQILDAIPVVTAGGVSARPRAGTVPHDPGGLVLRVELETGERLVAGHCGFPGAHHVGDPTLQVLGPDGASVGFDDDGCAGLGSLVVAAARRSGVYALRPGCFRGGTGCGGIIGYRVEPAPPPPPPVRVVGVARGLIGVGVDAGALVADGLLEAELVSHVRLRLAGTPLGLGGGQLGGLAVGSLHLSVILDADDLAVGLGGGVSVAASRFGGLAQREAFSLVPMLRLGRFDGFHVEGQIALGFLANVEVMSVNVALRVPGSELDFILRGAGGADGVLLAEAALVFWLLSQPGRGPLFGLSAHAGAGAVFYEPLCRFGASCAQAHVYAGPVAGVGFEWRP
jgi:hypothetical protein